MNPVENKDLSFGDKARILLSYSWIPGIPQIARCDSTTLRKLKIFFFIFCLSGFLYQSFQMFLIYLNRPIVLSFEVEEPESILVPAMTLCPSTQLNKRKYCKKFPERCENMTVKEEFLTDEFNPSYEMLKELGLSWKDIILEDYITWLDTSFSYNAKVLRMPFLDPYGRVQRCFVVNHQLLNVTDSPLMFPINSKSLFHRLILLIRIILVVYNDIRMTPNVFDKVINLHSPFLLKNPFKGGNVALKQAATLFFYKIREVHRLPSPFSTNCTDYPALWKKFQSGPVSRDNCIAECIYEKTQGACGCYALETMTYRLGRFCNDQDAACLNNLDVEECYQICPLDCQSIDVEFSSVGRKSELAYDLLARYLTIPSKKELSVSNITNEYDSSGFIIYLLSNKKLITRYKPKYELIEVFSYIGGYIGIWLGISLAGFLDLLGILWRMSRH